MRMHLEARTRAIEGYSVRLEVLSESKDPCLTLSEVLTPIPGNTSATSTHTDLSRNPSSGKAESHPRTSFYLRLPLFRDLLPLVDFARKKNVSQQQRSDEKTKPLGCIKAASQLHVSIVQ